MIYAKLLQLTVALLLLASISKESRAQFSIRQNAANPAAVDILYKAPPVGQGIHPVQFFEFALQIPLSKAPDSVNATWVPAAPLAALSGFQAYKGIDFGHRTFAWASTGSPNYANTYNFPATEVVLGTVTFSAPVSVFADTLSAIDYQNQSPYGGSGTQVAVWTMQVDAFGTEVTDYNSLFYQAAMINRLGSTAPFTTADGSATNQKVTLWNVSVPVTLMSFSATKEGNNAARLNWQTAMERNSDYVEVERSADGKNFNTAIGRVKTAGESDLPRYYRLYDHAPLTGTNYYRLKMVDVGGAYTYSEVRTVTFDGMTCTYSLSPNPAKEQITVKGMTADASIMIFNTAGQLISETKATGSQEEIQLNMAAGIYYMQVIQNGSIVYKEKFVKQ